MDEVFEHEASIGRAEPVADACPAPPLPGGTAERSHAGAPEQRGFFLSLPKLKQICRQKPDVGLGLSEDCVQSGRKHVGSGVVLSGVPAVS